jgi:hypothetical protein
MKSMHAFLGFLLVAAPVAGFGADRVLQGDIHLGSLDHVTLTLPSEGSAGSIRVWGQTLPIQSSTPDAFIAGVSTPSIEATVTIVINSELTRYVSEQPAFSYATQAGFANAYEFSCTAANNAFVVYTGSTGTYANCATLAE